MKPLSSIILLVGPIVFGCSVQLPAADNSNITTNQPRILYSSAGQTEIKYICDSNREPMYQGLSLTKWIQSKTKLNPNNLAFSELLRLKQSVSTDEWDIVRFEFPVNYDAVHTEPLAGEMKLGTLNEEGDFVECCFTGDERITNGHCRVWWAMNWNSPGKHNIRAQLIYHNGWDTIRIIGPPLSFESQNACQFLEGATFFNSEGTQLYARLRSSIAAFRIELSDPEGRHLKTVTGSTKDGYITNEWNLVDERGKKFEGDAFDAVFYIAYPGERHTNAPVKVVFTRVGDRNTDEGAKN